MNMPQPFLRVVLGALAIIVILGVGRPAPAQSTNYPLAATATGLYYPNRGLFYLQDSDGSGAVSDVAITNAPASALPLTGNWTAGSTWEGIGLYDRAHATFYLKNNATTSGASDITITYGWNNNYLYPVAGDWTAKGYKSIGTYDPTQGIFYLRNENDDSNYGYADITTTIEDPSGHAPPTNAIPIVGDWVGNGKTRLGYFDPNTEIFYYCTSDPVLGNSTVRTTAQNVGLAGGSTAQPITGKWSPTSTVTGVGLYTLNPSNPQGVPNLLNLYTDGGNTPYQVNWPPGIEPVGAQLATPPICITGKWQPTRDLTGTQNTSPTTTPSWLKNAIIYEIWVQGFATSGNSGTFTPGTFKAATYQLPYLKSLGITCIKLNPVEKNYDYDTSEPDQFNTNLGASADFTAFVDAAHADGIKVLCDIVTDGIDQSSPYLSGTVPPSGAWPGNNPLTHDANNNPVPTVIAGGLYQFDWSNPGLQSWYANYVGQWSSTYHFDGIRIDSEPTYCGSYPLLSQLKTAIGTTYLGNAPVIMPEHMFFGQARDEATRAYTYDTCEFDYVVDPSNGLLKMNGASTDEPNSMTQIVTGLPESYYTCGLDTHDQNQYNGQGKLSRFAWGELLSPFIPHWFMGDEYNAPYDPPQGLPLFDNYLNLAQSGTGTYATFLSGVKSLIGIRKTWGAIFSPGAAPGTQSMPASIHIADATASGTDLTPYTMWQGANSITVLASDHTTTSPSLVIPIGTMGLSSTPYFLGTNLLSGGNAIYKNTVGSQTLNVGTYSLTPGSVVPFLLQSPLLYDKFDYTDTTLNNQVPDSAVGKWVVAVNTGTSTYTPKVYASNNGQCNFIENNGVAGFGTGLGVASYGFTAAANTIYTLQATPVFTNHTTPQAAICNIGFATSTGGGGAVAPWQEINPTGTAPCMQGRNGNTSLGFVYPPPAQFNSPMNIVVTWNTATGLAQYYINGVLEFTATTTLPTIGTTYYAFCESSGLGNEANLQNITLTTQPTPPSP
jgi:hypothetical protein